MSLIAWDDEYEQGEPDVFDAEEEARPGWGR